eukprot:1076029-Pyramimonas_sp.AAC.1
MAEPWGGFRGEGPQMSIQTCGKPSLQRSPTGTLTSFPQGVSCRTAEPTVGPNTSPGSSGRTMPRYPPG